MTALPMPLPANDLAEGFAKHIVRWAEQVAAPTESLAVLAIAAYQVSLATQTGHVCARLADLCPFFPAESPDDLSRRLLASRMVAPAAAGKVLPLILDSDGRLYLYRYYSYERRLADNLRQRFAAKAPVPGELVFRQLAACFADPARKPQKGADWQKLAVALAWRGKLTIISGGPGTGKTSTVVALLAVLLAEQPESRVALAAPTGKAAARLLEALRQGADRLPAELRERLPHESHTLHRLLGVTPQNGRYHHHADNPLPIDALVVDEASMLDLALACHLFEALPSSARVVLLGDKDQLAAVEAGAVFAELSANPALSPACIADLAALTATPATAIEPPKTAASPVGDCVIWLSESHRFAVNSGIGRLAAEINAGRGNELCDWLTNGGDPSLTWLPEDGADLGKVLADTILAGYRTYRQALDRLLADPKRPHCEIFAAFAHFRVLCARREGARGVHAVNRLVEQDLRQNLRDDLPRSPWYPGRAVMVLRNDYLLRLFNGDIGICLPDEHGEPMVWFPEYGNATYRAVAPLRLPAHDSGFAITVHKAQGSEFTSVLLLLPEGNPASRELLYTGVTRAAKQVTIVGSRDVVVAACARRTQRHSGLLARLAENDG